MIEIIFESRYGKFLILISIWLNVSIGISILAGLVFRLIVWLKESSRKNTVVILYVLSISVFVALNALILSYFSLGYRTGLNYITSTTSPTYIFATSNTTLSIAITILSILSFILIWISSILLLAFNTKGLKKWYYLLMVISPVIFLSEYLFLWIFSYLRTTDIDLYFNIYTLTSNLGFPLGGVFFGLTFWILASNLKINSSKSQSLVRFKESIYFTSIGIILLTSSTASLDITKLPYPPFGLISFTFLNVGAFSFFLGIYTLATAMAGNPNIRSTIRNSEFLHSIAYFSGHFK